MNDTPAGMERRQRIREQMKEFYGNPTSTRDQRRPQDARKLGVSSELDLDSEYFNVSKYTTGLLQRESLKGLVEADTELLRSIRRLDGELQELVYKNYSKFISATDTIREMKENVTEMDSKLQALSSNVENIDSISRGIGEKLQTHRKRIEDMMSANRMLRKVKFLVELPDVMRVLLDRAEYTQCVKCWVAGDSVLTKHGHIPSIEQTRQECIAKAATLYKALDDIVRSTALDDPEVMDSVRRTVEDMRLMRATSLFTSAEDSPTALYRAEVETLLGASFDDYILKVLLDGATAAFNSSVVAVQRSIKQATEIPDFSTMEFPEMMRKMTQLHLRDHLAQLKSTCALFSVNCDRVHDIVNQLDDGRGAALRMVSVVQPVLVEMINPVAASLGHFAIACLRALARDAVALKTPAALKDAIISSVNALTANLKAFIVTLKTLGENYLDNAHSQQSRSYTFLVESAVWKVLGDIAAALTADAAAPPPVDSLATHESRMRYAASLAVLGMVAGSLESLCLPHLEGVINMESAAAASMNSSMPSLPGGRSSAAQGLDGSLGSARDALMNASVELTNRFIALASQSSLRRYVAMKGVEADAGDGSGGNAPPVAEKFGRASETVAPSGVSQSLVGMLEEWTRLYHVLSVWFPPTSHPSNIHHMPSFGPAHNPRATGSVINVKRAAYHSSASPSPPVVHQCVIPRHQRRTMHVLLSNPDRTLTTMTAASVAHPRTQEVPCTTLMINVVVFVLKGMVESVRAAVFREHAFQQVQVDTAFLLFTLFSAHRYGRSDQHIHHAEWLTWDDDATMTAAEDLVHECCTCAYESCGVRSPLAPETIHRLVGATTIDHTKVAEVPVAPAQALPTPASTAPVVAPAATPPPARPAATNTAPATRRVLIDEDEELPPIT